MTEARHQNDAYASSNGSADLGPLDMNHESCPQAGYWGGWEWTFDGEPFASARATGCWWNVHDVSEKRVPGDSHAR